MSKFRAVCHEVGPDGEKTGRWFVADMTDSLENLMRSLYNGTRKEGIADPQTTEFELQVYEGDKWVPSPLEISPRDRIV